MSILISSKAGERLYTLYTVPISRHEESLSSTSAAAVALEAGVDAGGSNFDSLDALVKYLLSVPRIYKVYSIAILHAFKDTYRSKIHYLLTTVRGDT